MSLPRSKSWIAVLVVTAVAAGGFFAFAWNETKSTATTSALTKVASDSTAGAAPQSGLAAADKDGDGVVYQDAMHPWVVLDAPGPSPDCGMELTPVRVDGAREEGSVRIDPATLQNIGVRTAPVTIEPLSRTIRTTGRIKMVEQGEHTVSLKISGWIEKLYADFNGAIVQKGQPLLELYSPDLVSTQEEYLLALRYVRRLEASAAAQDARRTLEASRRRLAYWDLSEQQIRRLEEEGTPMRTLTFYAPASGEVMRKQVAEGEYIEAGRSLMDIVDISSNWLIVDVYEQDLAWIKVGTPARVELPYRPGVTYQSQVDYIYHMLDMETRSAEARITLPGGHQAPIKPGMYATVYLMGEQTEPTPVVPEEAVVRTGLEEVVILALGEGRLLPQKVKTGVASGGKVQILQGLEGGETVVTSAQFLIDSEARLRSTISSMIGGSQAGTDTDVAAHAPMPRRVQIVEISVGADGFAPPEVKLEAGVPARLIFTRTTDGTCTTQVQIPDFGIEKTDLPLHEPVAIEFTPEEDGTFTFACGMDMLKGALLVRS